MSLTPNDLRMIAGTWLAMAALTVLYLVLPAGVFLALLYLGIGFPGALFLSAVAMSLQAAGIFCVVYHRAKKEERPAISKH